MVIGLKRALAAVLLCWALASCKPGDGTNAVDSTAAGPWCDVINDYAPPADCADFTAQAAHQVDGTAAFNAPNPMQRGDTFTVWLAVAANPPPPKPVAPPALPQVKTEERQHRPATGPASDASAAPTDQETDLPAASEPQPTAAPPAEVVAKMPGHTEKFPVTVGDYVAADLTGDEAFDITAKSVRTQSIHLGAPYPSTMWRWDVKALRGGDHVLVIKTVMQVKDREGQFHDVVATSQPYSFHVKVGVLGWLQDALTAMPGWIKLVTGVVLALVALLGAVAKLRKSMRSLSGNDTKADETKRHQTRGKADEPPSE